MTTEQNWKPWVIVIEKYEYDKYRDDFFPIDNEFEISERFNTKEEAMSKTESGRTRLLSCAYAAAYVWGYNMSPDERENYGVDATVFYIEEDGADWIPQDEASVFVNCVEITY